MLDVSTPSRPVPFVDLRSPHRELADEILASWRRILEDAAFVGGPELERFEEEFADFCGCTHAVGIASGTEALRCGLLALGLTPGDEVVTSPHTFIATVAAIARAGGRPVFADVDRQTGTLDPEQVEKAIGPRTRVLLPVHLYGQPADMEGLGVLAERHGLRVLEDAAQSHGACFGERRVGSLGAAAAFSFYPGKNLGACGEGGMVTTSDGRLAGELRMLRDHGQDRKHHHAIEGWNARLDALQAAALRIKLRRLTEWNRARGEAALWYDERLRDGAESLGLELPSIAPGRSHVWHVYVVRHQRRDELARRLGDEGIATGMHYPIPVHLQPAYSWLGHRRGDFPETERWASRCLSLPMHPELTPGEVERVCEAIEGILS